MKPKSFLIFLLMALCWTVLPASASRLGDIRVHARFLTDRMAYELRLSNRQYNDVFEINYDFLYNVDPYMDGMSYGDPYAVDAYYRYLDERNDDLRWVLSRRNYVRFMSLEHFYLPIYVINRVCHVRVYNIYPNRDYFYYGRPRNYHSYHGGHCRHHCGGVSFYKTNYRKHYKHSVYDGNYQSIRSNTRHRDFPRLDNNLRPSRGDSHKYNDRVSSRNERKEHSTIRPLPSQRVEHSPGFRIETLDKTLNRSEVTHPSSTSRPGSSVRPTHSTRPSTSSRPTTSSRQDREYSRPESSYKRPASLNTSRRESSTVRSGRTERRSYQPSSTRSDRSESVSRKSSHNSVGQNSGERSDRSERRVHRER